MWSHETSHVTHKGIKVLRNIVGAAAITTLTLLLGCGGAVKKPAEPTPAPPSLLGTWQTMLDADDFSEARHQVLTFRPDRYVFVQTERDAGGAIIHTYADSGGWEQSDTHITRIYLNDEADNARVSLPKRYTLTADTLTVADWDSIDPEPDDLTFTRVTDPAILTTLAGSQWTLEHTTDEGVVERWTLGFTDAGWYYTFSDPDIPGGFQMGGLTWTDDSENGVILAVVGSVTEHRPNLQWWVGQTLHFAYAPHGEADRLNVSPWFREQGTTGEGDERMRTAPHPNTPYGDYWHVFTRVAP